MANLVLVIDAEKETSYTADHITYLLRKGLVRGEKKGWIWLVDLDDLKGYEREMRKLGTKKYDPTRGKEDA